MKAAKAVLMVNVADSGGTQVSKSAVFDHCMEVAAEFARGVTQVLSLEPDLGGDAITWPESNTTISGGASGLGMPGTSPGIINP